MRRPPGSDSLRSRAHSTRANSQLASQAPLAPRVAHTSPTPVVAMYAPGRAEKISISAANRARLSADLSPYPFIAQPDRSIRVGLALCQLEAALWELAREGGDAIA